MSEHPRDVHLAGVPLERNRHVCAFFHTPEEEFTLLVPFIKEGIDQGEKAVHIHDRARRAELLRRLAEAGVDSDTLQQSGQLEMRRWEDAHIRGGRFDQETWLASLDESMASDKVRGFPRTRLWSNQEWALEQLPGVEDIVEYECRYNYIQAKYDNPTVCVFDVNKHRGDVVMGMLRTHPLVIIGGILHENPYYVSPDEFLRELHQRR